MTLSPDIFQTLSEGLRPSEDQLTKALGVILDGKADPLQISALLLGLNVIGLSGQEVRVGTKVMRDHMIPVNIPHDVIDIVGTGGTGLHTLSISTACAIVAASSGAKVAKHGNRAASSLTGTADTLSELGVNLALSPDQAAQCIEATGLGFLFAPNHHPAMRHVGPPRKALGVRTLFNLLGPLCNPARAKRQLLGVCDDGWRRPMAETLRDLGCTHVWVVHGKDGLDEITTTDTTYVSEVKNGTVTDFEIHPDDFGITRASIASLRGGNPAHNAAALTALLEGETGQYRDIVLLNTGCALMIAGLVETAEAGIERATQAIDTGNAKQTLQALVETSQSFR